MAARYWVGGTDNWNASAGSKWATTSGGAGGASVPTTADDVYFDANSGSGTITIPTATNVSARSIDFTGFTGTFAHASTSANIAIGDGTAGAGNIAIKFVSGMTYTLTGIGTITFQSTSSTVQTITSAGKTLPNLAFSGSGSKYQFADNTTCNTFTYTNGAEIDFNSKTITSNAAFTIASNTNTRNLIFGTGILNCNLFGATPFTAAGASNVTITASVGAQINASSSNNPTINLGSLNYGNVAVSHSTSSASSGILTSSGATIYSYTRTGSSSKTEVLQLSGTGITITNNLSINGNSDVNRLLVRASTIGTQFTLTNNGSYSISYLDFQDIVFAGSASTNFASITGGSGDCGGNSGATFSTPVTQTFGAGAGNASNSAKWTTRIPLPQDDVVVNASSGNITLDMPRVGKNVDFTGYTGTCSFSTSLGQTFYGSLTMVSGMTLGFGNTVNWVLAGRGNHTFDSGGKTFTGTNLSTTIEAFGGKYTLASAYTTGHGFNLNSGEFDTGNYTVTSSSFTSTTSTTRILTLGSSTWNLTLTSGTGWNWSSTASTLNVGTSEIVISTTSASTRTFAGGGGVYNKITYTVAGSTGQLNITGANTIDQINFSDVTNARTLTFVANTVNNIRVLNTNGTSGKLMSIVSATAGTATYLQLHGAPQLVDYASFQDVTSIIPRKLFATNSTLVSGNLNITQSSLPTEPYIAWQTAVSGSGSTTTAPLPFTPQAGDFLVAAYGNSSNGTGTITPASGFVLDKGASATTAMRVYSKVSDGTETSLSFVSTLAPAATTLQVYVIRGFTGTPTVDATDSNTGSSVTSVTTGSGATNTTNPAIMLSFFQGSGSLGATVSATNGFEWVRPSTEVSTARTIVKPLSSNGSNSSTFTWTTSRNIDSESVIYKFVASTTFKPITAMFM